MEDLAAAITKAASRQTYYTVRFLADRDRKMDAYRAYGYFRWVDDALDADVSPATAETAATCRKDFLKRQQSLLEICYRDGRPQDVCPEEKLLVELIGRDREKNSGLQAYLRNMMAVMAFDAGRRGRLISQSELDEYTRCLAVAVTEAVHFFIGHDNPAPRDELRYLSVSAAHITHMLRDAHDDLRAGYVNIPREYLDAHRIGPGDIDSPPYRAWVEQRVRLAREYFRTGSEHFRRLGTARVRLAGFAYTARFECVLDLIEKDNYLLRPDYPERKTPGTGIRMMRRLLSGMFGLRRAGFPADRLAAVR
jgi:phytoene/squalene synthetase